MSAGATPLVLVVPAAGAGERLDRFLATAPDIGTRSQAKQLIDAGRVRVDGVPRKAAHALRAGATVVVEVAPAAPAKVEPEPVPLSVLYEDADLLAVDKPAGLVVHPAPGAWRGTLVHGLLYRLGSLSGVGAPGRPGIVHRLDRHTSGVLLVARTAAALEGLARQFRERTVEKQYVAVVRGRVAGTTGIVDRPIGRHPRERKRMSVVSRHARPALTRWTVLERFPNATLLRLEPRTGRTHQLRVHLAALGHPILGDQVYGRGRRAAGATEVDVSRQALHAEQIRFTHPRTGERLTIRAPLAPDLERLLAALRQPPARTGKTPHSA